MYSDLRSARTGNHGVEAIDELLQGLVPRDLCELAAAAIPFPSHRRDDAIRVVRHLDGRLAADAQLSLAERMLRIAFELLDEPHANDAGLTVPEHLGLAVHHPRGDTASGGTERADTRLPDRDARRNLLVRHESDDLVLRAAAARQRGAGAGDGSDLQEAAAVHACLERSGISNDKSGSRSTPASRLWQFTQKPMSMFTMRLATVCCFWSP